MINESAKKLSKLLAYFGLGVAIFIWSISFISINQVLKHITVNELNIARFLMVNAVLWTIQVIRPLKLQIASRDYPLIFMAGVFGTAGYYYFENVALMYTTPGIVSAVTGAMPITTLMIAMLLFGKKTRFRNILLICLSFFGVILLMAPLSGQDQSNAKGIMMVLVANVFWALYVLINDKLDHSYDRLQLLTLHYTSGMVAFLGFYITDLALHPDQSLPNISVMLDDATVVDNLLFVVFLASVVAYLLYNIAIVHIGVIMSALAINVIPVLSLIISVGVGSEVLNFSKVMGCLFVVVAIFFIDDL